MFNVIGWIAIGFLTGVAARWFYPGAVDMNPIMTVILGIAGSFAGGFIGGLLSSDRDLTRPTTSGFIMSVIGAMALIFIARWLEIG